MVAFVKTQGEFQTLMDDSKSKLVVIDFTASWCGPCKHVAPIFEDMAKEFTNVIFRKIDVDDAEELAQECGISAMPTFQFFKDGKKQEELLGADTKKLKELV